MQAAASSRSCCVSFFNFTAVCRYLTICFLSWDFLQSFADICSEITQNRLLQGACAYSKLRPVKIIFRQIKFVLFQLNGPFVSEEEESYEEMTYLSNSEHRTGVSSTNNASERRGSVHHRSDSVLLTMNNKCFVGWSDRILYAAKYQSDSIDAKEQNWLKNVKRWFWEYNLPFSPSPCPLYNTSYLSP
jgi:hypothetical protein